MKTLPSGNTGSLARLYIEYAWNWLDNKPLSCDGSEDCLCKRSLTNWGLFKAEKINFIKKMKKETK